MINPASKIIEKCGGHHAVASMLGIHPSRVYRWTYPPERGGTGGIVPSKHQARLMIAARQMGVELSPNDFFNVDDLVSPCGSDGH